MRNRFRVLGLCLFLIGWLSFLPPVNAAPGDLDTTFSQDGKLFDFFSFGGFDNIYGTAIQTDGKIVAVGQAHFSGVVTCGISRYNTDGALDPTFDGDGRALIPTGKTLICRAIAIQTDGKIVAAGYTGNSTNDDFAVVRFNTDGSLDTSFDFDGIAIASVGSSVDQAFAVAIQPDGKIVAAGRSYSNTFADDFALVRYNTDGSVNASLTTSLGGNSTSEIAYAVAIQADGKIVAAGYASSPNLGVFALVRYNPDCSLDTSFDSDGKVLTPVGNSVDQAYAVAIQPDGKIVAAGTSLIITGGGFPPEQNRDFSLVRYNADGSLDTSFDSDGKVITNISSSNEQANAVAIQTNGKIVVAGYTRNSSDNEDFAVVRYNTDGSPDTSFDSDGIVTTSLAGGDDAANAIAIQTDGKIVAAGVTGGGSSFDDFMVVRYNTDGSLDTSFSSDGKTNNDVGFKPSFGRAVATQANGKFVVAGFTQNVADRDFAVSRYNADGSPDTSFDTDGKVVTPVLPGDDEARAVAIQTDGKVVVAGTAGMPFTQPLSNDAAVLRYNTDGSLDTTFDLDGKVLIDRGVFDYANAVAIQLDGKIVIAGYVAPFGEGINITLIRLNANGSLDTSFDSDGIVTVTDLEFDQAHALAIQPDGKIVAAGRAYNGSNVDFAVVRYNTDGSPDTSFDSDGKVTTPVLNSDEWANAVAIQANGKIVAAGFSNNGSNNDFAVVRYNADGSLDTSFDSDGKLTTPVLSGADQANAVAIQANGKILVAGSTSSNGFLNNDFALVRYNADGSLDTTFNADGKVAFDFWGSSNDLLYGMALDSNSSAIVVGEASQNFAVARVLGDFVPNAKSPFDFDGDGRSDISVFRPSNGTWYLLNSSAGFSARQWGISTDVPVPADYDNDGKTDLAVWRPSEGVWYLMQSTAGFRAAQFGAAGDIPVPGDFDGDGAANLAVFRRSTGSWYIARATGVPSGNFETVPFGANGDKPIAGADFDGDGKADVAVFRPSDGNWYRLNSSTGQFVGLRFGIAEDKPVAADYDGDGKTDLAVWRPSNGAWYRINSQSGSFTAIQFGINTDLPAPADYDGDGKADLAVFRPSEGNWYLMRSTQGFAGVQFGANHDLPTPNSFVK